MKKNLFISFVRLGALGTFFVLAFISGLFSKSLSSGKSHHETGDNSLVDSLLPDHVYAEVGPGDCDSDGPSDGPGDC